MKNIRTAIMLAMLATLTACGDNGPSKDEVKDFIVKKSVSDALATNPFQRHTEQETHDAIEKMNKAVDIQSMQCSATKGFKNVWDCTVNVMMANEPTTGKIRFHRDDNGKLQGESIAE